jgi:short subunit dehydrogenase-like uncharacterized protein
MPQSDPFLIYGVTGYTGRLMARMARERGLRPVLSGRNAARLAELATELGLEYRVASLEAGLDEALRGMRTVIHAAGPFGGTWRPMVEACMRAGCHYLDVSGEWAAIEGVRQYGGEARRRGVMLMPAVGFDVVPSDCLALHVARRLPGARRLRLAVSGLDLISRGSVKTLAEFAGREIHIRRGGELVGIPPGSLQREFDFGAGPRLCFALSWADLGTAYYTTGIPDLEVYYEANPMLRMNLTANRWFGDLLGTSPARSWFEFFASGLPEGPAETERVGRHGRVVAEVEDDAGRRARSRLCTPEAYTFTCDTALAIARRVLAGDLETGFQTPARVYGPDFVLTFPGVTREDF